VQLRANAIHIRVRKIDFVDDRDDSDACGYGRVVVGHRLRLHALARVDDEDNALTRMQAAGDLRNMVMTRTHAKEKLTS
jgi:hypothetical protein